MQAENAKSVALAADFRVFILVLLAVSLAAGLVKSAISAASTAEVLHAGLPGPTEA